MPARFLLCLMLVLTPTGWGPQALGFSDKPVYIDPALGGWAAPLQTVCFEAGCGKLFYVAKDIGGRANIAGPTVGI